MASGIDAIIGGEICSVAACRLRTGLRQTGGVGRAGTLSEIGGTAEEGVFVFIGGRACERDASLLHSWFRNYVAVGSHSPVVRTWPLLVVSPHASRLIRDLRDATGIDLNLEYHCELVELDHSLAFAAERLCEHSDAVAEVLRAVQRLILDGTWRTRREVAEIRGAANYRQTLSVLKRSAEMLHDRAHETLSRGRSSDRPPDLQGLAATLKLFIDDEPLQSLFDKTSVVVAQTETNEQVDALAEMIEESRAQLQLLVESSRTCKRWCVIAIDDHPDAIAALQETIPEGADLVTVDLPAETPELIKQVVACGGEPSEKLADAVMVAIQSAVASCFAVGERGSRLFFVVDIRLHVAAPAAGLALIRRIRDQFPGANVIATTVRRNLADSLADEGVDVYIVKRGTARDVARQVWTAVQTLASSDRLVAFSTSVADVKADPLLRRVLFDHAQMNDVDVAVKPAFFVIAPEDIEPLGSRVAGAGLIIVIDYNTSSERVLTLLQSGKRFGASRTLILKRVGAQHGLGPVVMPSTIARLAAALVVPPIAKHDVAWSILVPRTAHGGELQIAVDKERLAGVRAAISQRFGGATTNSVDGVWVRPSDGREVKDDLERIEVWGRRTAASWQHMMAVGESVAKELRQKEVYIQERAISTWEVVPNAATLGVIPVAADGRIRIDFAFGTHGSGNVQWQLQL